MERLTESSGGLRRSMAKVPPMEVPSEVPECSLSMSGFCCCVEM